MKKCKSLEFCEKNTMCQLFENDLTGQEEIIQASSERCYAYNRTCAFGNFEYLILALKGLILIKFEFNFKL